MACSQPLLSDVEILKLFELGKLACQSDATEPFGAKSMYCTLQRMVLDFLFFNESNYSLSCLIDCTVEEKLNL